MFRNTKSRLPFIAFCLLLLCFVAVHARQDPQKSSTGDQSQEQKPEAKPTATPKQQKQGSGGLPASIRESISDQKGEGPIRMDTDVVSLTVTVIDPYNRLVTGLDRQHFEIYEDKVKQNIEYFNDDDVPVSMGIVFDVSGSMKGKLDRARDALKAFIQTCHNDDDFFLVGFNQRANLLAEFTDGESLATKLTLVDPKGQTALYDAAYIGVEKVRLGRHPRKAILLISDGQDNNSRYSYKELKQLVKEADVQIYAIGVTNVFSPRELDIDGQVVLEELTRLTGGRAFFPSNEAELNEVITRIGLELRHQYSIGYEPTGTSRDGSWHKIRLKVSAPKGMPPLTVRTREGYFAQKNRVNN